MASTMCATCETRASSDSCTECDTALCDECRVVCQVCKKIVCQSHVRMTSGGRNLCGACMEMRALAKSKRRIEKKALAQKKESLSFEDLSQDMDEPASAEGPDAETGEATESPAKSSKNLSYVPDNETLRMPIDDNRPILTASSQRRTPAWVFVLAFTIFFLIMSFSIPFIVSTTSYSYLFVVVGMFFISGIVFVLARMVM